VPADCRRPQAPSLAKGVQEGAWLPFCWVFCLSPGVSLSPMSRPFSGDHRRSRWQTPPSWPPLGGVRRSFEQARRLGTAGACLPAWRSFGLGEAGGVAKAQCFAPMSGGVREIYRGNFERGLGPSLMILKIYSVSYNDPRARATAIDLLLNIL
jgi:hypothetical protein